MTTYGRFLEVHEVARMKSLMLWFVISVFLHHGVVAEIELYPDVTSDDYPLDELSMILRNQQRQQLLLQQRERQLAAAEAVAAAEAAAAAAAAARSHRLQFPREAAAPAPLARLDLAAAAAEEERAREPVFSYKEPAGQAADGEAAPFAVSPSDPRFFEDARSQNAELAGGEVYRSGDYNFRGGDGTRGDARDSDAADEEPLNAVAVERADSDSRAPPGDRWAERSEPLGPSQKLQPLRGAATAERAEAAAGRGEGGGFGPSAKKASVESGSSLGQPAPVAAANPPVPADLETASFFGRTPAAAGPPPPPPPPPPAAQSAEDLLEDEDEEDDEGETDAHPRSMSAPVKQKHMAVDNSDVYFIAIVAGCCAAAIVGIIGIGISWYRKSRQPSCDSRCPMSWHDSQRPSRFTSMREREASKNGRRTRVSSSAYAVLDSQKPRRSSLAVCPPIMRLQKSAKAAADVEYPAYGVTGPNKDVSPTGDRRLAQSAQMYHYQHQKQQIIAMERVRCEPCDLQHKPVSTQGLAKRESGSPSIIASQFSSRRTQTEHEGRDSYDYRREQASLWGMDPDRTNLSPGREAAERSTYVVGSAERQIAEVLPIESNVDQTLKHEAPRLEKAQKPLKEGFKATEELISKSTDEVPRNEGSITADDKVAIPWETAAASRAVMHASLEPVNPHASERTDSRTSGPAPSPNEDNKLSEAKRASSVKRGSRAIAAARLESTRGSAQVRRVLRMGVPVRHPRPSSLGDRVSRTGRSTSLPARRETLTKAEAQRKSIQNRKILRSSIPVTTQRLRESTRRALEKMEERPPPAPARQTETSTSRRVTGRSPGTRPGVRQQSRPQNPPKKEDKT